MDELNLEKAADDLRVWCRKRDFSGYDPFDALNSRVLQATPFKYSGTARLIWTQAVKRSPLNMRPAMLVPAQKNSKGIALFALAALANYRRTTTSEARAQSRALLDELLRMRIQGYSGSAWGYNFDWQSRKFFAPQGVPMIVPTAFAVRAMIEAHRTLNDDQYLETARSSCEFILKDLKRTVESDEEACFSYSPLDNTRIFNASLFAAEVLATVGALTGESELYDLAIRGGRYVIRRQGDEGSWPYGAEPNQQWIDNFHTAYVLLSLSRIIKSSGDAGSDFDLALRRGYSFWRERFFLADGWPKYYHDNLYPADTHAAATAIVALVELQDLDPDALSLAGKIAGWTLRNLRDREGFFYYQRRRFYTVHTPFMRWTQGWMLYALERLLEERG
ncbi:MAG: hypothetical protein M3Y84_14690 [Acidobacteriota bacterium]|nr:hypothetical protein [Acidobacteriota bacterium]